jgi:glycosyltransferase involved in cell wall biosynthesis
MPTGCTGNNGIPMVFIFDSHPVQYKAPLYQHLEKLKPGACKVIYATDSSMRGHHDREFNQVVAWDTPLLEGYPHIVLNNQQGTPFKGFRSLSGRGVFQLLKRQRPSAVLLSQFLYQFDLVTYLSCRWLGIPIWIRHETQDEAFPRSRLKTFLRSLFYRAAYAGVSHAFYIGQLNREHLLRHGVAAHNLSFSPYCSPVQVTADAPAKNGLREETREPHGIKRDDIVLLFSGKLIEKKNPQLILDALELVPPEEARRFHVIFVGSGPLEEALRDHATLFPERIHFTGFINQSAIPRYYLAADILVLPSRRAGETWGLVVNEALQAGCSVIMTNAVGCHPEFSDWERVRVIPDGDARACAQAMRELSELPRSFDWSAQRMETYSVEAAAAAIARQIDAVAAVR